MPGEELLDKHGCQGNYSMFAGEEWVTSYICRNNCVGGSSWKEFAYFSMNYKEQNRITLWF